MPKYAPDDLMPEPDTKHRISIEEVRKTARARFTPWVDKEAFLASLPSNDQWCRSHLIHSRMAIATMFMSKAELVEWALNDPALFADMRSRINGSRGIFSEMSDALQAAQSRLWIARCAAFVKSGEKIDA